MQMRFENGKQKAVTLSYDDGPAADRKLIAILNRYGLKGTFNLNSGYIPEKESDGKISYEEGRELYKGHEVAVHGLTHPWTASLKDGEILYEVLEDRKNLEREFGYIVRGMAYPFGCFNDATVNALKTAGIVYSRTTVSTHNFNMPDDWLRLPATCHHNDPELMNLARRFAEETNTWGRPVMFYLWGHSYEFDGNDNWDVIEKFAEYIGNRDDVWYATNMEIYNCVKAYEALHVSADMKTVYNPSAQTVWFEHKGKVFAAKPGESVKVDG